MNYSLASIVADNLCRLRKAKRFTEEELAERAGVSLDAYRNIESGESPSDDPHIAAVRVIASVLGVSLRHMLEPVKPLKGVRFRATKNMHDREQILADVSLWFYDFCDIEQILGDHPTSELKNLLAQFKGKNVDPVQLALRTREHYRLGKTEPIYNIRGLLEHKMGLKVGEIKSPSHSFFGLSISNEPHFAIVINTWEKISVERWIFTAAHELGHLVLHANDYDTYQTSEDKQHEREADSFASHFLMPNEAFTKEWHLTSGHPLLKRVLTVKRIFNVSYQTVLYRLHENNPDVNIWGRFQAEFKRRYGKTLPRSIEPYPLPEEIFSGLSANDFPSNRLPSLARKAVEGGNISVSRAAELLKISLHEMRDLMRSWVS